MLRLLALIALAVRFALHKRPHGGGGSGRPHGGDGDGDGNGSPRPHGGDGDGDSRPSQRHGSIDSLLR